MIILKESVKNNAEIFKISVSENLPVIFPTDTIYGIGAPLSALKANRKIYEIKKRPLNKPFPILAADCGQAESIADFSSLTDECLNFFQHNFHRNITFIIKAKNMDDMYISQGKAAVRISSKDILTETLRTIGEPVTATSVNESGYDFINTLPDIIERFKNDMELFISGKAVCGESSDIYDISGRKAIKIR